MRLLPRFSLRFAWIALTIFLIVFAVVVNYYQRYQAHERIATQLMNVGCDVEEESIQLLGFEIGKRLRGIQITSQNDMAYVKLLKQLPRPHEMQRFGSSDLIINQESIAQLLEGVASFPKLEELYLHDVTFTQEQVQLLGRLPRLRVLDLTGCNLPVGSLPLLEKLPLLQTLILSGTTYDPAELLKLNLPQLRTIDVSRSPLTQLALTKSGWGRFPRLETLSLRENKLRQITAEPGALPQLRHLDLDKDGFECQVDWKNLPAALPELTLLAMPMAWFKPDVIPQLAPLAKLRYVYFDIERTPDLSPPPIPMDIGGTPDGFETNLSLIMGGGQTVMPPTYSAQRIVQPFSPLKLGDDEFVLPAPWLTMMREWLKQRPDLLFSDDHDAVQQMLYPTGQGTGRYGASLWSTPNWRPSPNNGQGMNGGGGLF